MHWPGRTIWDTRVQSICGIISARDASGVHLFPSASFAQVSISPPRVMINPNRMHSIEAAVRQTGRFSINVLPATAVEQMIRLMGMRRRQKQKDKLLGLTIAEDDHQIPYILESLRIVFCEVENTVESGDRRLYVGRVLESRLNPTLAGYPPLLFRDVTIGKSSFPRARRRLKTALVVTGALDLMKQVVIKLRPPPPADIAATTYREAGATEAEIATTLSYGLLDEGRRLAPPRVPAVTRKPLGICVVGTGWGQTHCQYLRRANPEVRLFVCGRNPQKTARLAKVFGAEDYFLEIEKAVMDERVQGITLALPHDLHRWAVEICSAAGKHVLVEKPIATTLQDADCMIRAAQAAGTILMVAEDMHFRPAIREAVRLIDSGGIGEPLHLLAHAAGIRRPEGWAADRKRLGGGVAMDIGVHYIRALRLLMGEPDEVFAVPGMQVNTKMSGEDSAQLLFSSRYGWRAHMFLSWSSERGLVPDIVVAGEKGTLHLWPRNRFFDYYPTAPRSLTRLVSYVRPYSLQERLMSPKLQRVRMKLPDRDTTGYLGEIQEFLSAISEDRQPISTAEDARRDLEIVLTCYKAMSSGRTVEVEPLGSRIADPI